MRTFPQVRAIGLDVVRHALPLFPFYFYHGSVPAYLLLTAFDLALGLMLIVGTTRDAKDPTTVDPRAALLMSRITAALILAVFLGSVAAFLTIPLGIPAFLSGMGARVDWIELVTGPGFYMPVALMTLTAGVRAQLRFEAGTRVGERGTSANSGPIVGDLARDRRIAKGAYAAQVTLIGVYVGLAYGVTVLGRHGLFVFPALYSALLVLFDARPDIGRRVFPELWRETPEKASGRKLRSKNTPDRRTADRR